LGGYWEKRQEFEDLKGKCVFLAILMGVELIIGMNMLVTLLINPMLGLILTSTFIILFGVTYNHYKKCKEKLKRIGRDIGEPVPWWV